MELKLLMQVTELVTGGVSGPDHLVRLRWAIRLCFCLSFSLFVLHFIRCIGLEVKALKNPFWQLLCSNHQAHRNNLNVCPNTVTWDLCFGRVSVIHHAYS